MLEFSKIILEKVSFNRFLFNKELRKLILWMGPEEDEVSNLHRWCVDKFGDNYADIIDNEFGKRNLVN